MSKRAGIFPGQGAQLVGMGRDVAAAFASARTVFDSADRILGFSLSTLCFEGPADRLNATDIQQPAIFTTSVALHRAAVEAGLLDENSLAVMGGLSLGEYTALHLADALEFEDALGLVQMRGRLMQAAAERRSGGMVSLIGLEESQAVALCERVADKGVIRPANFNCPGQIVISGEKAACDAAVALISEFGGRAVPLPVAGAFHSPLMREAADAFREPLRTARFRTPRVPVVSNVNADFHTDSDSIRDLLYRQIFSPVRWQACVERMMREGVDEFWEIGPNRHLAGMLKKINRGAKVANLGTLENLEQARVGGAV